MALTLINSTTPTGTIAAADVSADMTAIENAVNTNSSDIATLEGAVGGGTSEVHLSFYGIIGASESIIYYPLSVGNDITIVGAAYYTNDDGTGDGTVTVSHGNISSGSFSSNGSLVNATIPSSAAALAAGPLAASGTITSSSDVLQVQFTRGTGQNPAASSVLLITLRGKTNLI